MRRLLLLLIVTTLVGASVSAARAAAPVHATRHYESEYVTAGGTDLCAFDVRTRSVEDQLWTTFADGSFFVLAKADVVFTNLASGRHVYMTENYSSHVDPASDVGHTVGALVRLRDDEGHLLASYAGQIAFADGALAKTTPNAVGLGTPEPFCDALAG